MIIKPNSLKGYNFIFEIDGLPNLCFAANSIIFQTKNRILFH